VITRELLAEWLEDDGHAGCAEDLLCASVQDAPRVAREVADHCVTDPYYDDTQARDLPVELRAWADQLESALTDQQETEAGQ
jgi:hypothetical protein